MNSTEFNFLKRFSAKFGSLSVEIRNNLLSTSQKGEKMDLGKLFDLRCFVAILNLL